MSHGRSLHKCTFQSIPALYGMPGGDQRSRPKSRSNAPRSSGFEKYISDAAGEFDSPGFAERVS